MKRVIINIIYVFIAVLSVFGLQSCQKTFLAEPITSNTTADSVFSDSTRAMYAISQAYGECLSQGLPYENGSYSYIQDNISGALIYGISSASGAYQISVSSGFLPTAYVEDIDGFNYNFQAIRQAWLVRDNIDIASDMTQSSKNTVKAEMKALVAYRYEQMLIMYGGVPIVTKVYNSNDDLGLARSSVREVLDSIVSWCTAAAAVLPSVWPDAYVGRMTKSAALAIKAKALLYAARPLFNSATPYLSGSTPSSFLCLGNYSAARWDTAASAAVAVISEAENNGGLHIINTGNPFADYGNATSTPSNAEVILGYKNESGHLMYWLDPHQIFAYSGGYYNGLTTNFLENYYKSDGSDQSWPDVGVVRPFSEYQLKMNQMEPRFKASFWAFQTDAWVDSTSTNWKNSSLYRSGSSGNYACAIQDKFFYNEGTRGWIEIPIFRLAAYYLSAAEAYNELGNSAKALTYLNVIHQRAGLPAVTETNQSSLRTIIQREWNIEFFGENYYLHDIKHWKLSNLSNGLLGGSIRSFTYNNNTGAAYTGNTNYQDIVRYTGYWSDKEYLNPFPTTEVQKGYIVQNPGY